MGGCHLPKTLQSLSASMASNPAILVLLLSCVYISLAEAKPQPQPIFDIARIFSPIAAGGKKRHRGYGYNDCCYDDYDDYRRRRRRSALERGPLLDTLEDRGGYRKVRQNERR